MKVRPNYYETVNITYSTDSQNIKHGRAWLAVNDDGKDMWTLDGTDKVIMGNEIICWWY